MNNETKAILKEKILLEISSTERDIQQLEELTKPISPDCAIGRVTRMDAINNKSVAESSLRMLRKKLANLQLAITKLPNPQYGKCSACGQPINEKRLMFLPESTYCIHCAH